MKSVLKKLFLIFVLSSACVYAQTDSEIDQQEDTDEIQESEDLSQEPDEIDQAAEAQESEYKKEKAQTGIVRVQGNNVTIQSNVFLKGYDATMCLGGKFREDLFYYDRVHTLRDDFYDQVEYFRHRLDINLGIEQGTKKYGKPAMEGFVQLTNYVYWQNNGVYAPFSVSAINSPELDTIIAKDVKVKPLIPLLYASQAWFKINIDTLTKKFLTGGPTFVQLGFFKYIAGRGISMGYHDDLAVEYLGWEGDAGFQRFRFAPPGILFSTQLYKDLTFDLYYMKWHELNASIIDTAAPVYRHLLDNGTRPQRGRNKDSDSFAVKLKYTPKESVYCEPYYIYTRMPEQTIEMTGDASSYLNTLGCMVDYTYNNWNVNFEVAGQAGHQDVHAIDRNVKQLTRTQDGAVSEVFSHVVYQKNRMTVGSNTDAVPASIKNGASEPVDKYDPTIYLDYIVNQDGDRSLDRQGKKIEGGQGSKGGNPETIYNADYFGNQRFRSGYKLEYKGFMAVADVSYQFTKYPFKVAGALGHISGDNYPYNEETSRDYKGFIPMRSRYKGHAVQSILFFDRQVVPRPVNICNRTLYAFNNLKDLSNLEFIGFAGTWFPLKDHDKMSLTTDLMFFWEDAQLKKWDKNLRLDDKSEEYLSVQRAKLGFPGVPRTYTGTDADKLLNKGWVGSQDASHMLGTEIDVRMHYRIINECDFYTKAAVFIPGQLYKDLDGQPNELTRRLDDMNLSKYESLGSEVAYGFIVGLNCKF
ncbi:MAG: hypothetical protein ABH827_00810 [bacterium]